jgi:hypothetical protein
MKPNRPRDPNQLAKIDHDRNITGTNERVAVFG